MKGIWRHLFPSRATTAKADADETNITEVVEKNRAARAAVASELERMLRTISDDMAAAADHIGNGGPKK